MDNLQTQDFVDDRTIVNPHKPERSPIARRGWNGQWTDLSPEVDNRHHFILSKLHRPGPRGNKEKALAELCGMDMNSEDWKTALSWLTAKGYTVWKHQRYDGVVKQAMVEMDDNERQVFLTGTGLYFASQSLPQLGRG